MHIRRLHPTMAAVAICAATACGMPVPTSGPSPVVLLEIRGTTLMMIGGRGTLTAWQIEDGHAREVAARWTADGDAISITSGGVVAARRLGHAVVHAQYDDHRGTETVHVVTSVAGIWRGSLRVIDCWQVTASAPDPCEGRRGLIAPLVLTVSQSAAAELGNLTATIAVFTPPATGAFRRPPGFPRDVLPSRFRRTCRGRSVWRRDLPVAARRPETRADDDQRDPR